MMLRTRSQESDAMVFRWARTEMKREMAYSQSSYAKIAGLQSEVGRVVVTRVAGSELEYKRHVNMYRRDMTCSVNNIRREQIKMRRKIYQYVKKLKQARLEHAKLIKEQKKRDEERAQLEELHLRLKLEAAAKTPEPEPEKQETIPEDTEEDRDIVTPSDIDLNGSAVYIKTGVFREPAEKPTEATPEADEDCKKKNGKQKTRRESRVFSPILPMINEDAEKDLDNIIEGDGDLSVAELSKQVEQMDNFDLDDTFSIAYRGRKKKKKDVSFSDIIKLKYASTQQLFDLVHIMAKKHGIPDVVEKVPDPRDHVVHRGSTNGSFRLEAAVLYPMKFGYVSNTENSPSTEEVNIIDNVFVANKSPKIVAHSPDGDLIGTDLSEANDAGNEQQKRFRKLSFEERRAIFMSGVHSRSVDGISVTESKDPMVPQPQRKLKSRDRSMPDLMNKVAQIKSQQADRDLLSVRERHNSERIPSGGLLSPLKPSSSHSSKSLPVLLKNSSQSEKKVSWTEAFGILRAIHSLEDVSS